MHRNSISGLVEYWKIHVIDRDMLPAAMGSDPALYPAVMTGVVVEDFKGRFPSGTCMRSSLLVGFDLQNMTINTLNSTYQLKGLGFIVVGMSRSYDFDVGQTLVRVDELNRQLRIEAGTAMDEPLARALAKRFPIYRVTEEAALFNSFGFGCGPGWVPLLIEFAEKAAAMNVENVQVRQIKEKWNTLRIYVTSTGPDEDRLDELVEAIETKSAAVCEVCGKALKVSQQVATGTRCAHDGLDCRVIAERMLQLVENKAPH